MRSSSKRNTFWFNEIWNKLLNILTRFVSSQLSEILHLLTETRYFARTAGHCPVLFTRPALLLFPTLKWSKAKLVSFYVSICRSINYIFLAGLSPPFSWEYVSIKPSEAEERIIPRNGKTKWIMDHNNINTMSAALHVKSHCLDLPSLENQNLTAVSFLISPNFHIQTQL